MEPHPDLTAHDAADTAKPRFLMDLFDRGARHDGAFSAYLGARP